MSDPQIIASDVKVAAEKSIEAVALAGKAADVAEETKAVALHQSKKTIWYTNAGTIAGILAIVGFAGAIHTDVVRQSITIDGHTEQFKTVNRHLEKLDKDAEDAKIARAASDALLKEINDTIQRWDNGPLQPVRRK